MTKGSNNSAWILVVLLAVVLQVAFVFADCKQTATGTAVNFSKAFFLLDTDMENYICSDLVGDGDRFVVDGVGEFALVVGGDDGKFGDGGDVDFAVAYSEPQAGTDLASLTGGGQGTLFDDAVELLKSLASRRMR